MSIYQLLIRPSNWSGAGRRPAEPCGIATVGEVVPAPLTSGASRSHDGVVGEVIRLMVVDDHHSFRSAVAGMVAGDARFEVAGDAASGEAALALAASIVCDLVVMDVRMPGMGGLAAASELRRLRPDMLVVLVSTGDLPDELAAEVGAIFVPKISLTANALEQIWAQRHNGHEGGVDHARDR